MGGRQSSPREELRSISKHLAAKAREHYEEKTAKLHRELHRLTKEKQEQTAQLGAQRQALQEWKEYEEKERAQWRERGELELWRHARRTRARA